MSEEYIYISRRQLQSQQCNTGKNVPIVGIMMCQSSYILNPASHHLSRFLLSQRALRRLCRLHVNNLLIATLTNHAWEAKLLRAMFPEILFVSITK
jgi:hypothetical protein